MRDLFLIDDIKELLQSAMSGLAFTNRRVFVENGPFVVPQGVDEIYVTAIAAGNNGGNGTAGKPTGISGDGGVGGTIGDWSFRYRIETTPGTVVNVTTGNGNTIVGSELVLVKGGSRGFGLLSGFAQNATLKLSSATTVISGFLFTSGADGTVGMAGAPANPATNGPGGKGGNGGYGAPWMFVKGNGYVEVSPVASTGLKGGDSSVSTGSKGGDGGTGGAGYGAGGGGGGGGGINSSNSGGSFGGTGGVGAPGIVIIEW